MGQLEMYLNYYEKKYRLLENIIILVVFICLPLSILLSPFLYKYKFCILILASLIIYIVFSRCGYSKKSFGITKKNLIKSIKDNLLITIIMISVGVIIYNIGFYRFIPSESLYFYIIYILVLSPAQEFLYRGVLTSIFEKRNKKRCYNIIVISLLYSFLHIMYLDIFTLILTFIIGLIWQHNYLKSKNLLGVSISHSVLGALTIFLGIIN